MAGHPDSHQGITGHSLDEGAGRIATGQAAGDKYIETMETIRDNLNTGAGKTKAEKEKGTMEGTSVGRMVGATIEITEADITFSTESGIAKNASNKSKEAASGIKKTGES
jgi:hypothetical protein